MASSSLPSTPVPVSSAPTTIDGRRPDGWRIAVVGAAGFAGRELIGLLIDHPEVASIACYGSARHDESAPPRLGSLHPAFDARTDAVVPPFDLEALTDFAPTAVFLATPHQASDALAGQIGDATGAPVLDLSGAFRLGTADAVQATYGFAPERPSLVASAVYGLVERAGDALRDASLVAVPGCYPTASILALAPLVDAGILAPDGPRPSIIAASGVSGAGRTPTERSNFCNVSFEPYGVIGHRHQPEIERHAGTEVVFVPHLAAWDRGILATIHATVGDGVDTADVRAAWSGYDASPFVHVRKPDEWPSVASVRGTNRCELQAHVDERGELIVVSAIDNLLKGAAGQAIQCLNVRFGVDEEVGLPGARRCLVTA